MLNPGTKHDRIGAGIAADNLKIKILAVINCDHRNVKLERDEVSHRSYSIAANFRVKHYVRAPG